nr:hypothetical protein [Tanacetum cinerariifolium]
MLLVRDCGCSKGNVEDKILVPKPPKNYARCTRCGYLVVGLNCQGCALLRQELEENLESHSPDFQNTSEPSNASTNVINDPREPYVVKQDNESFVDKIIFDLNRAPDSPNQFHCFHCKDVLRDGEALFLKPLHKVLRISTIVAMSVVIRYTASSVNDVLVSPVGRTLILAIIVHQKFRLFTLDSTPTYVDESPNVFNPPPQFPVYPCEFYGNDAYYGHYCTPQAPFVYPEPCYNQDFNFPQEFQNVPQQYRCCDDCGVTHDAYQCQPMNEVYYYGQNSCYDSSSIGFDQSQPQQYTVDHPIFNAHNDYLDSQIQLNSILAKITDQMISITSLCEMACQVVQKKLEEKQLEEERAAKAKYWKLSVCYDDDDDEERSNSLDDNIISGLPLFSTITPDEPVLSTEEPDNSLSMGDEHLDTIPTTESDELIKSGVENLSPIPSESEGIPDHMYDVLSHDNSPPLDVSLDTIEDFSESNEEFSSTDDDSFSFDKIDYVEASPLDSELVSSKVMEIVFPEVGGIEASNDNHILFYDPIISGTPPNLTPSGETFLNDDHSSNFQTKSSSTSLNSLLEETHTFNNSLPEFTTFSKVLFDAECESDSSDDHSCFDEDVLEKIISKHLCEEEIIPMKSLCTHDSSLPISSKIDSFLEEFTGELSLLKSIPPGIDETDCDFEEDIRLIEKLLYDNSSSRPPEEFISANSDAKIKSFSPSPILVEDSDSLMKEICYTINHDISTHQIPQPITTTRKHHTAVYTNHTDETTRTSTSNTRNEMR